MLNRYVIKIWETEHERELGVPSMVSEPLDDVNKAIIHAKRIMERDNHPAIEVQNVEQTKTYYFLDGKEEKYYNNSELLKNKKEIEMIIDEYFEENNITDLMDYGSDYDRERMRVVGDVFYEMLKEMNIKVETVTTENISDGKYLVNINFENSGYTFKVKAGNDKEFVKEKMNEIYDIYEENLEERIEETEELEM